MSEYFAPSEQLGHQCDKPADALQLADAYIHEISNQVTIMLGISELAQEAARGDSIVSSYIEEIVQSARRAARATHKLLELKVKQLAGAGSSQLSIVSNNRKSDHRDAEALWKERQPSILP